MSDQISIEKVVYYNRKMSIEYNTAGIEMRIPATFAHYKYIKTIGCGSTGVIIQAYDKKTGMDVAGKVLSRQSLDFVSIEQELRIHQFLDHPHILKIFDIVYTDDLIIVVTELCERGDLLTVISNHEVKDSAKLMQLFYQICDAVSYLHKRGIAHLDIKPDNILVDNYMNVKLSDFGCCESQTSNNIPIQPCGTLYYAAPEMLTKPRTDNRAADIWSLGIVLCTLYTEHLPWLPGEDDFIKSQILQCQLNLPYDLHVEIHDIIYQCCKVNPDERIKVDDLLELVSRRTPQQKMSTVSLSQIPKKRSGRIDIRPNLSTNLPRPNIPKQVSRSRVTPSKSINRSFPSLILGHPPVG